METNYNVIANELIHNKEDIEIKGIYINEHNVDDECNLLNCDDEEMNNVICKVSKTTQEPMLYHMYYNKEIPMYKNTLPIHRKVYDKANLEMYKLLLQVKELNPKCEFVGTKKLIV